MPLRSLFMSTPRERRIVALVLAGTLCTLVPDQLRAVDAIALDVADVHAPAWSATGISARLEIGPDGKSRAFVTVRRARFPEPLGELRSINITCAAPVVRSDVLSCRDARVTARHAQFGRLRLSVSAQFDRLHQALAVTARGLKIAGAAWRIDAHWRDTGWRLDAAADRLAIAEVRKVVAPWFAVPADIDMNGTLSPRISVMGGDGVKRIGLTANIESLSLNNADGTLATDKLAMTVDATLAPAGADYNVESRVRLTGGQAYRDPVFVDLARGPVDFEFTGAWQSGTRRLAVSHFTIDQPGVLRANGDGVLAPFDETIFRALRVNLEQATFPGLYSIYLQPFLVDTSLKDLATKGALRGTAELRDGSPAALDVALDAIDLDDSAGHLAMHGLNGRVVWRSDATSTEPSRIAWNDGQAYGFSGGAAQIRFLAAGRSVRMLEATKLPIFDGGLAIAAFEVRDVGTPTMSLLFDATLEPISMPRVCKALGWPEFSGTVAGRVPRMTFKDKILSFDGDLEARVFDGRMTVSKLRLEDPLGVWPRLSANVDLERLDLQAVTGTFSFGEITGRLSGYIHDLELFAWRPIAFDALLATPPGDRSEHRISQRAISNISAIGGGSSGSTMASLSSGFLRFFQNFKYDRLGLACKLESDVCTMRGIGPARNGYYIVKGRGIPRIDVIGSAGRIDWPQLVANLKAATAAGPPTTKPRS
jgi:hypothetical protein